MRARQIASRFARGVAVVCGILGGDVAGERREGPSVLGDVGWGGAAPRDAILDRIVSMAFTGDLFASDAVYEDAVLPDHVGESYRGLDGVLRAARSWLEPFEWLTVELTEIIDTDDCVVSLHRARMKTLHTEIEFESPLAYVFTFQDGKVIHRGRLSTMPKPSKPWGWRRRRAKFR
jgi:ketosteroid isomerase-like protein